MKQEILEDLYRRAWSQVDAKEPEARHDQWLHKFAELIVRECTNMLPTDSIRNEDGVHMFYVIRDHFGVSPFEGVR